MPVKSSLPSQMWTTRARRRIAHQRAELFAENSGMPVKRTRTTHGLITRETVSIVSGENSGPPTDEDWKAYAEFGDTVGAPERWFLDIEQAAREVLRDARLPDQDGIPLRNTVAERLHTREWFAAEVLRHVTFIRNDLAHQPSPWHAIKDAYHLGVILMMAEVKLGLEADTLLGRKDRQGRRAGAFETNRARRLDAATKDMELLRAVSRLRQSDHVTTDRQAASIIARQTHRKLGAVEKQLSRARRRVTVKSSDIR